MTSFRFDDFATSSDILIYSIEDIILLSFGFKLAIALLLFLKKMCYF